MIAAWMLYCTAFGILIAGAALLAESAITARGGQTRRVWGVALLASALLPVVAMLVDDTPAAREVGGVVVATSPAAGVVMESVVSLASLDRFLALAWFGASALLLSLLAGGCLVTWRRRRRWSARDVDGVRVLVSKDLGPAVVGFVRGTIVLPGWALDAAPEARAMMLRHEREHVAAGDPRLLLFAALTVSLMPWNAAVWYLARRLRLAIEIDCDRRVMGAGDLALRDYAELLISVGTRRKVPAYAIGFSVGRPFLEHRIDRLTTRSRRDARRRCVLAAVGVALALAAAWDLPQPVRAAEIDSALLECPEDWSRAVTEALLGSFLRST